MVDFNFVIFSAKVEGNLKITMYKHLKIHIYLKDLRKFVCDLHIIKEQWKIAYKYIYTHTYKHTYI